MNHYKRALGLIASLLIAVVAHAGMKSMIGQGFDPAVAHQVNAFDSVNTYNGRLMVNVPLGPEYNTNGSLKYRFNLGHNHDRWAYIEHTTGSTPGSSGYATKILERDIYAEHWYVMAFSFDAPPDTGVAGIEAIPVGNAGMGWNVDFGSYGAVSAVEPYPTGRYTDVDGSSHVFTPSLHAVNYDASNVSYTHDGSYLRLRIVRTANPPEREIDFPDGARKRFRCVAECGTARAQWNLEWISDPFGNVLLIERSSETRPGVNTQWVWEFVEGTLPDGETRAAGAYYQGGNERQTLTITRRHRLTFIMDRVLPLYPWAGERLTKAELAGPNGDYTMVYTFGYRNMAILRAPVLPWAGSDLQYPYNDPSHTITASMLDNVVLPAGAGKWQFDYYAGTADDGPQVSQSWCLANAPSGSCRAESLYPTSKLAAELLSVRAPTGGGYGYKYAPRIFPARPCVTQPPDAPGSPNMYNGGSVLGVSSRQELDVNGRDVAGAVWRYSGSGYFRRFVDDNGDDKDDGVITPDGRVCRDPIEYLAATLAPNGLLTLQFHNSQFSSEWYGAPFTPHPKRIDTARRIDGTATSRYLSTQIYEVGDMSDTSPFVQDLNDAVRRLFVDYRDWKNGETETAATLLRSNYVLYDKSAADCAGEIPADCEQYNLRLGSEHQRFDDDPETTTFSAGGVSYTERPFVETVHTDYDGLGHYRQTNVYGNLKAVSKPNGGVADWDARAELTAFNPGVNYQSGAKILAGGPTVTDPWLTGIYTRTAVWERVRIGSVWKSKVRATHVLFDKQRGYLRAQRTLTASLLDGEPPAPESARGIDLATSAKDLLTVFTRKFDSAVLSDVVLKEENYGGDGGALCQNAATESECAWPNGTLALGTAQPEYVLETTSRYGAHAKSEYRACDNSVIQTAAADVTAGSGQPKSETNANGLATSYEYDGAGRMTKVTPPGGLTAASLEYSSATGVGGVNRLLLTRTGAATETYQYDGMGRLTSETHDTPAGAATTSFKYTLTGKVDTETLPTGAANTVQHRYDVFDRETRLINADGGAKGKRTETEYTGIRELTTTTYMIAGAQGANNAQLTKKFDSFGRLTEVNDGILHAEYEYDAGTNLTKASLNEIGNTAVQVRRFDYDGRGFLIRETHPELRDATYGPVVATNAFDARGHVTNRTFAWETAGAKPSLDRWALKLVYDSAERLLQTIRPKGTAGEAMTLKRVFYNPNNDPAGSRNQLSKTIRNNYINDPSKLDGISTIAVTNNYSYSNCGGGASQCTGMLGSVTTSATSTTKQGTQQTILSATVGYGYDNLGQVTRIDYPVFMDGPARAINYRYTYDMLTSVTEGLAETPRASISYYINGLPKVIQLAKTGVKDEIALDNNGLARPRSISWTWACGKSPCAQTGDYAYDGAGNISAIGADQYGYDRALRLSTASIAGLPAQNFTYDAFGNMTAMGSATFAVDSMSNHLQSTSGVRYDEMGNVIAMKDGRKIDGLNTSNGLSYLYDPLNMMVYMHAADIERMFVYDAENERVGVIDIGGGNGWRERWSLRDASHHVLRDFTRTVSTTGAATWRWTKDYVYRGSLIANTITPNASGAEEVSDLHLDHLGSVRFVTGQDGALRNQTTSGAIYRPYGGLVYDQTLPERIAFTGHERDDDGTAQDDADLDYMHARYYSSGLGRFLSVDPMNGALSRPQSWNRYPYASDNPINRVDLTGRADKQTTVDPWDMSIWTWALKRDVGRLAEFVADPLGSIDQLTFDFVQPFFYFRDGVLNDNPSSLVKCYASQGVQVAGMLLFGYLTPSSGGSPSLLARNGGGGVVVEEGVISRFEPGSTRPVDAEWGSLKDAQSWPGWDTGYVEFERFNSFDRQFLKELQSVDPQGAAERATLHDDFFRSLGIEPPPQP